MIKRIGKWWDRRSMWQRYALSTPVVPFVILCCIIMAIKFLVMVFVGAAEDIITTLLSDDSEG